MFNVEYNNKVVNGIDLTVLKELEKEEVYLFEKYGYKVSSLSKVINAYKNNESLQKDLFSIKGRACMLSGGLLFGSSLILIPFSAVFMPPLILYVIPVLFLIGVSTLIYGISNEVESPVKNLKTTVENNIKFINCDHLPLEALIKANIAYYDALTPRSLVFKQRKEQFEHDLDVLKSYSNSRWRLVS